MEHINDRKELVVPSGSPVPGLDELDEKCSRYAVCAGRQDVYEEVEGMRRSALVHVVLPAGGKPKVFTLPKGCHGRTRWWKDYDLCLFLWPIAKLRSHNCAALLTGLILPFRWSWKSTSLF